MIRTSMRIRLMLFRRSKRANLWNPCPLNRNVHFAQEPCHQPWNKSRNALTVVWPSTATSNVSKWIKSSTRNPYVIPFVPNPSSRSWTKLRRSHPSSNRCLCPSGPPLLRRRWWHRISHQMRTKIGLKNRGVNIQNRQVGPREFKSQSLKSLKKNTCRHHHLMERLMNWRL